MTTSHHTTSGPHSSGLANKLDPRVDSDRDGSSNLGATRAPGGSDRYAAGTTGAGTTGAGTTGAGVGGTTGSYASGPHSSNLANKADPRVDSDRDGSRNAGLTGGVGNTGATGGYGAGAGAGTTGLGGTTGTAGGAGPHSSNLANRADPRVDSDRDGSRNAGLAGGVGSTGTTGHHTTGTTGHHTTGTTGTTGTAGGAGPHSSNLANKADPRVDSDRDGSRNAGLAGGAGHHTTGTHSGTHHAGAAGVGGLGAGATAGSAAGHHSTTGTHGTTGTAGSSGPGPAPHTAGPHKSDLLNKLDPRVDSNQDGSRTVGGNKTYT